ncbi:MAG: ABC transporter ATP-binding protein [Spirochaetaceae bacterium]|nr:MAG: ABC transporter ATP-binding protein [Spirochaetaceae bacterium]
MSRIRRILHAQRLRIDHLIDVLLYDTESYDGRVSEDLGRLWRNYLASHRGRLLIAFLVTLVWSTHAYIFALATQYLVDNVIQLGSGRVVTLEENWDAFVQWAALVLGTWTMVTVTQWIRSQAILHVGQSLVYQLRTELHEKLQKLHVGFFERQETGKLMSRVLEDVWVIREWSTTHAINISAAVFQLVIGTAVALAVNWKLTLMILATLPFYYLAFSMIRPTIRRLSIAIRRVNAGMYARSQERIGAIGLVKAFDQERRETLNFRQRMQNSVRLTMRVVNLQGAMVALSGIITAATTGIVIYTGFTWAQIGTLTVGEVVFFINVMPRLFMQISTLSTVFVQIQAVFVVIKRVFNLLDEEESVRPGSLSLDGVKGSVHFDHVNFGYPGQSDHALHDVSFYINPGERVALMGPSGAGKSTVFNLILRFYDPQRGTVAIDGINLVNADPRSLRRHAVLVQQEPVVFSGTVAENITYGRDEATATQIMDAARQAELHDFIMTLPVKYETEVGQNGVSLSGGQKQRLALATALLTTPEILLLDDTTSALDAETEAKIRATLNKVMVNRTSIVITQRIATARSCDRIIVLEQGRIVQQGTHDELKDQEGFYKRVLTQQESI